MSLPNHSTSPAASQKGSTKILDLFFRLGLFDLLHGLWPARLTVLAYHRITDPEAPGFDTFKPNVSASPTAFASQMDFIRQRFNVIALDDLLAWLAGHAPLPANPALITFDDGYRDNLDYALPVLHQRNLPAVLFLATNYMGQATPFYWDLIAYCFYHTTRRQADLALAGRQSWSDESSRFAVMKSWLGLLKKLPDHEKWAAVKQLPQLLDVTVAEDAFAGLHLTWEQVRHMVAAGVAMGAHTQNHPILTRVSLEQAHREVTGSKARIEAELNAPITTFAYPNGLPTDFNPALQNILRQSGFEAAFTLTPGPARPTEVRRQPMAIRRILISYKDSLPRFAAKVMGLPRLTGETS